MKKFFDLILLYFRKALLPLIILVIVSEIVQVNAYLVGLESQEAYQIYDSYDRDELDDENVVCEEPVLFMQEGDMLTHTLLVIVTRIVGIIMIIYGCKEDSNSLCIYKTMPISKFYLFLAKWIQVLMCLAFITCFNNATYMNLYGKYITMVHEKFRAILQMTYMTGSGTIDIFNSILENFTGNIVLSLIITYFYFRKYYGFRLKNMF